MKLPDNSRQVYSPAQIAAALDELAARLNRQLQGRSPLVLTVMQGGLIFAGQLIPRLRFMLEIDYIHATRYHNTTRGSDIEWKAEPAASLQGREVLVLDDILDEGHTLRAVIDYCREQGATQVHTAVLLKKQHQRCVDDSLCENYALSVADDYVFGFGMDYNGQYRQLNGIYALSDEC